MRVRAKTYMYYDRRGREAGEEYEMDEREMSEAVLLEKLGKIEILPTTETAAPPRQVIASLPAEEPPPTAEEAPSDPMATDNAEAIAPPPEQRRTFRRRNKA